MNQIFVDGVEEVSIVGGVVRVDLFSYAPGPRGADKRPPRELVERLCLPPEAFLQMYGALDGMVKQLQERGLVQRKDAARLAADEAEAGAAINGAQDVQRARGSANF
ncbi:hypothetical protein [Chitinimonas koreensis]|uniref:hypothetical protein n=1 Tax=Chitinimonas koreensis TaxID=356302 RepID=UPI0004129624|nr:hypothetical protein [Chitinimonas koreensis]QNM98299.1 hypothetical protein H9L41_08710 [Chitinimonas koreensis]